MEHGLVYRSLRARFTDCATRPVAQGVDAGVDDSQAAAGPSQISRICPSFRGSTSPRGCCLNTFFLKGQLCPAMRSPSCLLQEDIRLLCPDAVPSWGLSGRTDPMEREELPVHQGARCAWELTASTSCSSRSQSQARLPSALGSPRLHTVPALTAPLLLLKDCVAEGAGRCAWHPSA